VKSEFTDNERTILIGLLAVARRQLAQIEQTRETIAELIEDDDRTCGRASDAVFDSISEDPVAAADELIGLCKLDAERKKGSGR
jgi:hypothetical protein